MESDIEQEPEELTPEEIMGEIRQMLMADLGESIPVEAVAASMGAQPVTEAVEDYFLLTPDMRCDHLFVPPVDKNEVHKRAQQLLGKLSRLKSGDKEEETAVQSTPDTAVTDWLNTNLPQMLEQIVAREVKKVLDK